MRRARMLLRCAVLGLCTLLLGGCINDPKVEYYDVYYVRVIEARIIPEEERANIPRGYLVEYVVSYRDSWLLSIGCSRGETIIVKERI